MADKAAYGSGQAPIRCAVATSDGFLVDQHFGRAKRFEVYEALHGAAPLFIETRRVQRACSGQGHDSSALDAVAERLGDCSFVIVAKIGPAARAALIQRGIEAYEVVAEIEAAIEKVMAYRRMLAITDIFEEE